MRNLTVTPDEMHVTPVLSDATSVMNLTVTPEEMHVSPVLSDIACM